MLSKVIGNREFISLSGKLWVSNTIYDFEFDEQLNNNEEIYMNSYGIMHYVFLQENREVKIVNPSFQGFETHIDAVIAMRKFSKILLEMFPSYGTIIFSDNEVIGKIGDEYVPLEFVEKTAEYKTIRVLSGKEEYKHIYEKIDDFFTNLKRNTGNQYEDVDLYIFDEYALHISDYSAPVFINLVRHYGSGGRTWQIITPAGNFMQFPKPSAEWKQITKTCGFYGEAIPKITSPPNIPSNAFLTEKPPKFLQFTKSGIVETNGIFFAKEPLEEVRKPWYIVEKTKNGWEIYVVTNTGSDHYKIVDGNLYVWNPQDRKYSKENVEIDENVVKRDKVMRGEKVLYIPRVYIDELL